jgi:hypothetical protein
MQILEDERGNFVDVDICLVVVAAGHISRLAVPLSWPCWLSRPMSRLLWFAVTLADLLTLAVIEPELVFVEACIGTLTVFRPLERMIDSLETMEPRFLRTASRMRSLWRSWSMMLCAEVTSRSAGLTLAMP